jgi:long-chain fatty acid transport protein
MGNAHAAVADDYTATFYNPAAMTQRKQVNVGAGFIATVPQLHLDRDRATSEVPSELPPSFAGINLGALFPLGGLLENRVAIGLALYLPTLNLLRAEGIDAQVPQFYLFQNLPDKYDLLAAAAFEFGPWLSVGAGVQVLAGLDGAVDLHVDLTNRTVAQRSVNVEVSPVAAPTLGLFSRPVEPLRLGASWRGALQLDYRLPTRLVITELVDLNLEIGGTVLYSPHVLNLSAAWAFETLDLVAAVEASRTFWSLAPDPSPRFEIDIEGDLVRGIGLGDRLDVGNGAAVDLGFVDTTTVRFGLEQRPTDILAVRAGYTYRPTPAPVPTEAFNYVDADAHILSVGAGLSFRDPLEIRENQLHLDVAWQLTLLDEVQVEKTRGERDPVGDYSAGGRIHSISVSLRHDL